MKFINLEEFKSPEVEIISDGINYDLFNDADFYGMVFNTFDNELKLTWHYPEPSAYELIEFQKMDGLDEYLKTRGMEWGEYFLIHLSFKHVINFKVIGWDPEYPFNEIYFLKGIIFNKTEDYCYIEFVFCNELRIEIDCREVEFIKEPLEKDIKKTFIDFKRDSN